MYAVICFITGLTSVSSRPKSPMTYTVWLSVAAGTSRNSIILFISVKVLSIMLPGSIIWGVWRTRTVVTIPV